MMPFEWDVRVSSKDHTVTASTSETIRPPSGYTTLRDSTCGHCGEDVEKDKPTHVHGPKV